MYDAPWQSAYIQKWRPEKLFGSCVCVWWEVAKWGLHGHSLGNIFMSVFSILLLLGWWNFPEETLHCFDWMEQSQLLVFHASRRKRRLKCHQFQDISFYLIPLFSVGDPCLLQLCLMSLSQETLSFIVLFSYAGVVAPSRGRDLEMLFKQTSQQSLCFQLYHYLLLLPQFHSYLVPISESLGFCRVKQATSLLCPWPLWDQLLWIH